MVILGMLTWWYTDGWRQCFDRVKGRLAGTLDYFSFGLLLGTLFAPFRQISAGGVQGSLDVQVRAFFDRLISRCIGAVVRLIMIVIGGAMLLLNIVLGTAIMIGWLLVPLLPIVGIVLSMTGWLPWSK